MKMKTTFLLLCLLLISVAVRAQITTANINLNSWSKIENSTLPSIITTDGDNGDGVNDGAMQLRSTSTTPGLQGLQCLLRGTPLVDEQINIESTYYQTSASYLRFKIQLYNLTDNVVLAETAHITVLSNATVPATSSLSHIFTASSAGDQIAVRYVRTDDLNLGRQIGIDNLKINGQFASMEPPPAPLALFDLNTYGWSKIENNEAVSTILDDQDNGDGLKDGAILLKSTASTPALQGIKYSLAGTPNTGDKINLESTYYRTSNSYLSFKIQLYNETDNVVLAETANITVLGNATVPATSSLSHIFTDSSAGDQIAVRYVRTDDLNIGRQIGIDNLKVNGQFAIMDPPAPLALFDLNTYGWSKIENNEAVSTILDDQDNGDGLKDGAILLKSTATTPAIQGIKYSLRGTPNTGDKIKLESTYYRTSTSYLSFKIEIYNETDNVVLAETANITVLGNAAVPATSRLSYIFTASSAGDQIAVRYVRTDDLNLGRQIGIDNLKVNGQFATMKPPPAPLAEFDVSIYAWSRIENTEAIPTIFTDDDNGDGVKDGAIKFNSTEVASALQGLNYSLVGTPKTGEQINIESTYYQTSNSYFNFKIQVYNVTDRKVLAETPIISVLGNATGPATSSLSYIFTASSAGDQIAVRYVRTGDLAISRQIGIDYLKVNGKFTVMLRPCVMDAFNADIPLEASTALVETEIESIIKRYSDDYLGTSAPTAKNLTEAVNIYNALGITVNGKTISGSGTPVTKFAQTKFLKTFAQYLKFNPNDSDIYTKALNTVWLVSDRFCKGFIMEDYNQYDYREFAQPAIMIHRIKENSDVKTLLENVLYRHHNFDYLWGETYDSGINIDHIGNSAVVAMCYVKWIDSPDERYRYMKGFKRFMERFMSYTSGTEDGIKPDGSSFHHDVTYPGYTSNFNTASDLVYHLRGTSFQVNKQAYLRFRDAIMGQTMFSNDNQAMPLSMCGRSPGGKLSIQNANFRKLAVAGGSILGSGGSDPVMAAYYNRVWGSTQRFENTEEASFNPGYFQFNHSMAGVYRKDGWLAVCKGFNDNMLGAEIYTTDNRYGRYQSYGAVEIIYPGDNAGNGVDFTTWNWNYNPGTTVIRLPWDKLAGEKEFIDELQQKRFVGSLSFVNKNSSFLKAIHGTYGMFAMDFQEKTGLGSTSKTNEKNPFFTGPERHNSTFVFKKSVFTFDNMLICLGSGIANNDAVNTTLTTLYQRNTASGKGIVNVDGNLLDAESYEREYSGSGNHWLVDNYGTGFYVFAGSGTIKLTRSDQQVPQESESDLTKISANPKGNYAIGYIDHGLKPVDKGYEYVCMPKAATSEMTALDVQIVAGNKPYTVLRKDHIAHIVEYKPSINANSILGYAFFSELSGINNTGLVTGADYPCLVMSQYDAMDKSFKLAISNPDLGFIARTNTPSVDKQINIMIKGTNWKISQPNSRAVITGTANGETTIQFTVVDGLPVEIVLSRVLTSQVITFDTIPAKIATDAAFDLTARASSNLPVTYSSSNIEVATITGSTVTIIAKGTSIITAKQEGDDIYGAATALEQTLTVNPAPQSITFDAIPIKAIGDPVFDLTATASSNLPVTYTSSNSKVATISGSTVNIVGKGNTTITASQQGNNIFDLAPTVEQILRVNTEPTVLIVSPLVNANYKAPVTITINADAADADGRVSKVEFFNGTTKLGEDLTAPYSFNWNNVTSGTYVLTAKATDNNNAVTTSRAINVDVECPSIQVTIPNVYALNPSIDDKNTIFLGYGPSSITLNALVEGNQDFIYNWNTGATTPSISVSQAGTYTVSVFYGDGCQATASIVIDVIDVRCGNNNSKVQMCHNNNTICVPQTAVQSHLDHGDILGYCGGTLGTIIQEKVNSLSCKIYPNPINDSFNVSISSNLESNATISIYNIFGQMIDQVRFATTPQNVFVGDLSSGNYIVVVSNGFETFRSKIVKQ